MLTLFEEDTVIRGVITRIIWTNGRRIIAGIHIVHVNDPALRKERFTAIGDMENPTPGQEYEFHGQIKRDQKYHSMQIAFASYRTVIPGNHEGIERYLAQYGKWIGPTHAQAIVKAFGTNALRIIVEEPHRLTGIAGITAERANELRASIIENQANEAAMIEVYQLLGGAATQSTAKRAVNRWGSNAAQKIKANPFILTELRGIGFHTADTVHSRLGLDPMDLHRHLQAAAHATTEVTNREGHTVIQWQLVCNESRALIGDNWREKDVFESLVPILQVDRDGGIQIPDMADAEDFLAEAITQRLAYKESAAQMPTIDREGLSRDQDIAVSHFERSSIFVLTGAPGTGKTYTTARIIRATSEAGWDIILCAPTGKAAKQIETALQDISSLPASTIHSLLESEFDEESGEFRFTRNASNPLDCDMIIIDEFSMVDIMLAASLFRAIPANARILIVGDYYQLPSVRPGAVLRDLLNDKVPRYELTEIKRNAGLIVRACHAIKDGKLPKPAKRLDLPIGDNWRHLQANEGDVPAIIESLLREHLPAMEIDTKSRTQIISPTNETGKLSCAALNEVAKSVLNPGLPYSKHIPFGVGDRVVRLKNATIEGIDLDVPVMAQICDVDEIGCIQEPQARRTKVRIVNGDIGVVRSITGKEIEVALRYPPRIAYIPIADHNLKLAYCLTCHKMQGSETDVVILPVFNSLMRMPMVNREWLYTAISRAKQFIITIGDHAAMQTAIRKIGINQRRTGLCQRLQTLRSEGTSKPCSDMTARTPQMEGLAFDL